MRTRYSFYNLLINVVSSLLIPVLGFVKVRLFIGAYGSQLNGMQLTIMQYIVYLNVFELAYSLAFRQLMYKPLAERNHERIKEIYHGAKKIFNITGIILLVVGVVFSFIIPNFTDTTISNQEITLSFIILFLPFALSYFLMGPNFLIAADQKEYKINIWIQTIAILRMFLMIIFILNKVPYIWIFMIDGVQVFVANFIARKVALKHYPWLTDEVEMKDDKTFAESIKYTLANRLSTIANNNTDNIIISGFYGYGLVSIYGAYSYFIEAINKIINSIIVSPINSFGNLFNDEERDTYSVFMELYTFSTFMGTVISVCVYVVINQLVFYWIGDESYVLSQLASFFFAINVFYMTQREPVIICRDTNGLFKDAVGNSYLIAITKIILSVILIQKFQIIGILIATSISWWVVDFLYNPVLVYKKVFKFNPLRYYKLMLSRIIILFSTGILAQFAWTNLLTMSSDGMLEFLISCLILGVSVTLIVFTIYTFFYESFRNLLKRFIDLLRRKRNA